MTGKPGYKLTAKDFIPFKGALDYHDREIKDLFGRETSFDIQNKYALGVTKLLAYNVLWGSLIFFGLGKLLNSGLEKLVN